MNINTKIYLILMAVMVALTWPTTYLLNMVKDSWAFIPLAITVIAAYVWLMAIADAARDAMLAETKQPKVPKGFVLVPEALNEDKGFVLVPEALNEDFAKAVMVQHTLNGDDWSTANEAWGLVIAEARKLADSGVNLK